MGSLPPEERRQYQSERYYARKQYFINQMGGECIKCKSIDSLQFDHIDPDTKAFTISPRLDSAPLETIEAELKKCQLLCEKCHLKKTKKEKEGKEAWNKGKGKGNSHGTYSMAYPISQCDCNKCESYRESRRESRRLTNASRPQTRELIHGTPAGYKKEVRQGISTCASCKEANRQYMASRRLKNKNQK